MMSGVTVEDLRRALRLLQARLRQEGDDDEARRVRKMARRIERELRSRAGARR